MDEHELTDAERDALDGWVAPAAPDGFADGVLARLEAEEVAPRRRWIAPAMVAAAVAAGVVAVVARPAPVHEGSASPTARSTLALGERAVVVAEAGSQLTWRVDGGEATVRQARGDAFYRVDPGGRFVVETPAGQVRVLGTCFRVEIEEMVDVKSTVAAGAMGAVMASAVLVTVYEGEVAATSAEATVKVQPRERVRMVPDSAPQRLEPARAQARAVVTPRGAIQGASATSAPGTPQQAEARPAQLAALEIERDELVEQVADLKEKLEVYADKAAASKTYDLSPAQLRSLAERCELRWDMPGLKAQPNTVPRKLAEEQSWTDEEVASINEAMAEYHSSMTGAIRELYVEATGDPASGSMSTDAMIAEITDKTDRNAIRGVFQRLARERAGLEVAPAEAAQSVTERLYRLLTTAGDSAERSLSDRVGPHMAEQMRAFKDGFGSKSRSSFGCPN